MRSVLGVEIFAVADAIDEALIFQHDLQTLLRRRVPLCVLTFASMIIRSAIMTKIRLMIDLKAVREAFYKEDIYEIGCINRDCDISDALTKILTCDALLRLLSEHRLEDEALRWFLRETAPSCELEEYLPTFPASCGTTR